MPDITMCVNKTCPVRGKCYRYMAIPSSHNRQSYAMFKPDDTGECEAFWTKPRVKYTITLEEADARVN